MIGGRFSEPGNLLFGFTEISIKVEIHDNGEDLSKRIGLFLTDNSVPPIHESNLGLSVSLFFSTDPTPLYLLLVLKGSCILLFNDNFAGIDSHLLANFRILLVLWKDPYFGSWRSIGEGNAYTFEISGENALRVTRKGNELAYFLCR